MANQQYYGIDPEVWKRLSTGDTKKSLLLMDATRLVNEFGGGASEDQTEIKLLQIPSPLPDRIGDFLTTDGEQLFWGEFFLRWDAERNYVTGEHITLPDGRDFVATQSSGPGVKDNMGITIGPKNPEEEPEYWTSLQDYLDEDSNSKVAQITVGHFFLWPYKTPPSGSILANGELQSRTTCAPLWSYLERHPEWVKTEEEWSSIAKSNNGYCSYYSSGDGVSTFRTPKFAPYVAINHNKSGEYVAASLPLPKLGVRIDDLTTAGTAQIPPSAFADTNRWGNTDYAGVLGRVSTNDDEYIIKQNSLSDKDKSVVIFEDNIYKSYSDTVTPESMTWSVCISAYTGVSQHSKYSLDDLHDVIQEARNVFDSVMQIGQIFPWPYKTPPSGSVVADGKEVLRAEYNALWKYISKQPGWLKTEKEWQEIASNSNGYCSYYSSGDGGETFRLPKFAPYQMFVTDPMQAAQYREAGLPNIVGTTTFSDANGPSGYSFKVVENQTTGAFERVPILGADALDGMDVTGHVSKNETVILGIDASKSSAPGASVYNNNNNNNNTVTPESSTFVMCIVAFTGAKEDGLVSLEELQKTLREFEANLNVVMPLGFLFLWPFESGISGTIKADGTEYVRDIYLNLWELVEKTHPDWLKPEAEWQEIAAANNGYCPYYSDGDGEVTFRVPKFAPYQKIGDSAGQYQKASLPNIYGITQYTPPNYASLPSPDLGNYSGIFAEPQLTSTGINVVGSTQGGYKHYDMRIDASLVSDVYNMDNTSEVLPESTVYNMYIVAYNKVVNTGEADISKAQEAVDRAQEALQDFKDKVVLKTTPYIVETYETPIGPGGSVDMYQWYRLYSDGWLEQGGNIPYTGSWKSCTVNLMKPYKDISYVINGGIQISTDMNGCDGPSIDNKTATSFDISIYNDASRPGFGTWSTAGKAATE